jgi:WD40 repeat protein
MNFLNIFRNSYCGYFKESSNLTTSTFSLYSILVSLREIIVNKNNQGKNLFVYHTYQNLWKIKWFDSGIKQNFFFLINSKALISQKKIWLGDFLELWEYNFCDKIKKKSIINFSYVEEIWDFTWNSSINDGKKLGTVIICCGFRILFFNVPKNLPQFIYLIKGLFSISLINVYQWKIDSDHLIIITGDIKGNIVIFNLIKKFSIIRFFHNSNKNIPVNIIKIFLLRQLNKKTNYVISAGYDGIIKLWNIENIVQVVAEIFFSKRWINDIEWCYHKNYSNLFLITFENGFISYWNVVTGTIFNFKFTHQLAIWKTDQIYQVMISIGEDGDLNLIELNAPFFLDSKILFFLQISKFFYKNFQNLKFKLNCLQSMNRSFFLSTIGISPYINKNFLILVGGNSGILISYKIVTK